MKPDHADLEPRGFGEHTRGLAGEYAHELGWGLEEEQRTRIPESPQDTDGGTDYEYGARDFGDEPVNTARYNETPGNETPGETSRDNGLDIADNPAVLEKESMKQHGDPLDHNPEPSVDPGGEPLPSAEDNSHPRSPVAP